MNQVTSKSQIDFFEQSLQKSFKREKSKHHQVLHEIV